MTTARSTVHAPRARCARCTRGAPARQRGLTLFGLLFWAIVVGFLAYLLLRVAPTVNEYLTIQSAVDKIARSEPATVAEARQAFDKQKDIEYSISSIDGSDLKITKENDKVVIGFSYDKLVPLFGPVSLLIKYEGRSH
ncbi:MAG: DUF4845 domain-containing protein [Burkholderiales bacterium]|nr:DUF4845 domain-containing protein [Burkholderiales bacterium]MDE2277874.1 DUF4845 domain-containing protein [Burkholderiales bacterium]